MELITTIVTAPESTDMTVLETVKQELNITAEGDDAKLSRYIRQASLAIGRYINRELAQATVTNSFRINGRAWSGLSSSWHGNPTPLLLSRWPVVTIDTVVEAGVTLDDTEFEVDTDTGQIWRLDGNDSRLCWGGGRTDITYIGGYVMLTDLPDDLEQACIMLVTANWHRSGRDPFVRQESVPGVLEQQFWIGGSGDNAAIPPEVCALLDPYRRISI